MRLSIDPGLHRAGVALWDETGRLISATPLEPAPVIEGRSTLDLGGLMGLWRAATSYFAELENRISSAVIEDQYERSPSIWELTRGTGVIYACLASIGCRDIRWVQPRDWHRAIGVPLEVIHRAYGLPCNLDVISAVAIGVAVGFGRRMW